MKHNDITSQIMPGCLSTKATNNNIHIQLAETMEERKKIVKQPEDFSQLARVIGMYLGTMQTA